MARRAPVRAEEGARGGHKRGGLQVELAMPVGGAEAEGVHMESIGDGGGNDQGCAGRGDEAEKGKGGAVPPAGSRGTHGDAIFIVSGSTRGRKSVRNECNVSSYSLRGREKTRSRKNLGPVVRGRGDGPVNQFPRL